MTGGNPLWDYNSKKIKVKIQNSLPIISEKENKKKTNSNNNNNNKTWLRTQSMNNLTNSKDVSDESGISSGEDNNIIDSISRNVEQFSFLSVRERKNFFESLNSDKEIKEWTTTMTTIDNNNCPLSRSNSIGNLKNILGDNNNNNNKLRKRKRTKSLHDLYKTPVKEICQLFESKQTKSKTQQQQQENDNTIPEKNALFLLTQRRLQRGERKLEKLKNQITDVEENIKIISDDLNSITQNDNFKRKENVNLYTALERRLEEENSRLERLMQETARIIKGNQKTIMKLEKS
ncbi:conserved hypothetical protein [Pediculus humanus corporis]|uniref:Uncharacterized protein n=1 Tax=Pediculus humanus subsp. corporis TaxID=121224 RepID=E0VE18_PEDHC|nr:uncharacterized protein Phum_PHUM127770 [Pediculus humanus corporis]EEB11624.1 conserved hypothetical protein [Pediculus humanus corporis]